MTRTERLLIGSRTTRTLGSVLLALSLIGTRHMPRLIGKWRVDRYLLERVGDMVTVARTADRFLMRLDAADLIQRTILVTGRWDEGVGRVLIERLKPGDLFVDVGANVGYFSLLAASRAARVIAFEPNPRCHAALVENARLNGFDRIDARPIGLAEAAGQAILGVAQEANSGAGTLRESPGQQVPIALDTLDAQLGAERPALIKIDVEGAELRVIEGAQATLRRSDAPPVILEVSEWGLMRLGASKDRLFQAMADLGYQAEIVSPVRRSNSSKTAIYFQYDALFTKAPA
jgi:FkbM family methyltransferase